MADLPRTTFVKIAKAIDEEVKQQEIELQMMDAIKVIP